MKAYVIKNKDGRYYRESDIGLNFTTILSSANMYTDKIDAEMWVKENLILKECKVQEITISEDDLEEKYEVLKGVIHLAMDYACKDKKLYKRIQDFNLSTNRHNGDNNVYLEDAICFLTTLSKDARDESKKWGEFFEKVYQEQKAKEKERDD